MAPSIYGDYDGDTMKTFRQVITPVATQVPPLPLNLLFPVINKKPPAARGTRVLQPQPRRRDLTLLHSSSAEELPTN